MRRILPILAILAVVVPGRGAGAEVLEIPGTGACETVLRDLAAAYNARYPGDEVVVPPSVHSGGGIRLVESGKSRMARVARPLGEREVKAGLKYRVFARDSVVFAVGAGVTARDLTTGQLAGIFSGRIDDWEAVGGGKGPIRILLREPGDSSLAVIQKHIAEFEALSFTGNSKVLYHNSEMVAMLAKYRNAIGWITGSSLCSAGGSIKPLGIDGTLPTPENVTSGRYALTSDYAFVHRGESLSGAADRFLSFVYSEAGRRILKRCNLIPVDRN